MVKGQNPKTKVSIALFGELTIEVNGVVVSGPLSRSKKLKNMAQYLIMHQNRPVPHGELYATFWPDEGSANPRGALKTLMHRLRTALVQGGAPEELTFITVGQGAYQWNPALDTTCDFVEFEKAFHRLQEEDCGGEERMRLLEQACALYRGRLSDETELWMVSPTVYFHGCYLKLVGELCERLRQEQRADEAADLCRDALRFDELDEGLNRELILALTACGRNQEAMQQYNRVTELYYSELGVQVSDELRALYRKIAAAEETTDMNIDSVRDRLQEKEVTTGAFVCEFGIFQDIYRIEERVLARYGGRIFLGLLTVTNAYMETPEQKVLNRAMDQVLSVVRKSLRQCDIVSRFSPSQYVVLLPTVTYETGEMVMERIRKTFRREFPKSPVMLSCKLRPLRPQDGERIME